MSWYHLYRITADFCRIDLIDFLPRDLGPYTYFHKFGACFDPMLMIALGFRNLSSLLRLDTSDIYSQPVSTSRQVVTLLRSLFNRSEYIDNYDMILSLGRCKARKVNNAVASLGWVSAISSK
jgi:aromatic ring-opening dioxygenase LigB subunit